MRSALGLLLLIACKTERPPEPTPTTRLVLPESEESTIFVIVDLDESIQPADRFGRLGNVERLGGPTLDIEASAPHVIPFPRGSFNGVVGPERVIVRTDLRDGLDAVRLPIPEKMFALQGSELVAVDPPPSIAELRVPCDSSRAATRPSVEEDPEPRCAIIDGAVVITCATLATTRTARTIQLAGREIAVVLTQEGCRVELSCVSDSDCAPGFPMRAILPPRASASGEGALLELVSVIDPHFRCPRTEAETPTFACPDATMTLIPR